MDVVEHGYSGNKDAVQKRVRRIEGVAQAIEAGGPDATAKGAGGRRHRAAREVMTRNQGTSCRADSVPAGGVPGCDTGPVGRVAFVARELADLWRELRGSTTGNARLTSDPDTDKDTEKDTEK